MESLVLPWARKHDAVYAAIGAWRSASPRCENENAPGVLRGIEFLYQTASHRSVELGQSVIVVGGGSVAMDVALTAKRSGAGQVTVVTLEKADALPAEEAFRRTGKPSGPLWKDFLPAVTVPSDRRPLSAGLQTEEWRQSAYMPGLPGKRRTRRPGQRQRGRRHTGHSIRPA